MFLLLARTYKGPPSTLWKVCMLLLLLCGATRVTHAQQEEIPVFGAVTNEGSGRNLGKVTVSLIKDGSKEKEVITANNGKYEFKLDFGHKYLIEFKKEGFASKKLQVDTRNVTEKARKEGGFQMEVGMTLFKKIEGMDESVLDQPIGKASFYEKKSAIDWDYQYTAKVKQKIQQEKQRARKALERKKEKEEEYEQHVQEGDEHMESGDYSKAESSYSAASQIFPDRGEVKGKLEKAKKMAAQQEKLEEYEKIVEDADKAFGDKEYQNAKSLYEKALGLFPEKPHPKEQIGKIKKALEQQKEYDQLVSQAGDLFDKEQYEQAKDKYKEALGIFPDKDHPQDRLDEITDILEARQEKQKEYDQLVAAADQAFDNKKYEEAREKYEEALEIFQGKQHPKQRIGKVKELLAQQEKQQEQYNKLIEEADGAFDNEEYETARSKYQEALKLFQKDHPKSRVQEINKILAQQEEKQQQYDKLISEADQAFDGGDLKTAKSKYQEALSIFSDKEHPSSRLEAIDKKLAAQEEEQQQYDQLISVADQAFEGKNYKEAKAKYNEALGVFSDKEHPKSRISEIDKILNQEKEKQQKYDRLISEADQAFQGEEYESAKGKYQEALKLFGDKEHPRSRIQEIDNILRRVQHLRILRSPDAVCQVAPVVADYQKGSPGPDGLRRGGHNP